MASPKSKKISQESFGFLDEDRKNPKHDDIVKWIHNNLSDCVKNALKERWKPEYLNQLVFEPAIWEYRIISDGKTPVIKGFIDLATRFSIKGRPVSIPNDDIILFEAKTSIPSVGALIREIRYYKFYRGGIYVVVSPDDQDASLLRSQGIEFLKYEG